MAPEQTFQILHISDLHINKKDDFNRDVVLDKLIERVAKDRRLGFFPEIVVVTGDIVYKGKTTGYTEAKKFFDRLLDALELKKNQIFMVPGNHDVNRQNLPKGVVAYKNLEDINDDLKNERVRSAMFQGLADYFDFVATHYNHLISLHPGLVPFVHAYSAKCGKTIGLVGLNSAWMCRKSKDDMGRIAIGEFQILKAIEERDLLGKLDFFITIFHHPLNFLWEPDRKRCQPYFDQSMLLFGHIHDTDGEATQKLSGRTYRFQAGSVYAGKESSAERYSYITIDWVKKKLQLDFRKFDKDQGKWCAEGEKGQDSTAVFDMFNTGTADPEFSLEKKLEQDRIFGNYTKSALVEHRHLPTQGFETNVRISIELERVYINMRAHIQSREFDHSLEGKSRMMENIREQQLSALDIKAAFTAVRKHHIKDLVILGDPGSGKTTLLKYILLMLIQDRAEEKIGLNSDMIPFFAPLRELRDPGSETFVDFIQRVCRLDKFSISSDAFTTLLDRGRGIVLLDGLDEVANETDRIKTCQWLDEARKHYAKTTFIVTSRFAGYLGQSKLEGNCMELSVQDFTDEEIEAFLIRWFETIETILHPGKDNTFWKEKGRDAAQALVARINASEHIRKLAVNPLLLQIIALVHRDRGTLPPSAGSSFTKSAPMFCWKNGTWPRAWRC